MGPLVLAQLLSRFQSAAWALGTFSFFSSKKKKVTYLFFVAVVFVQIFKDMN